MHHAAYTLQRHNRGRTTSSTQTHIDIESTHTNMHHPHSMGYSPPSLFSSFLCCVFLLVFLCCWSLADATSYPLSHPTPYPMRLTVSNHTIYVNDTPFFVKGVFYNPANLGTAPAWTPPWGDYLQPYQRDTWDRDFPVMRSMGINTVRVANWNNDVDHGTFLDAAHKWGMKLLGTFRWQVGRYLHHPALLAWSFGAELNAPWNNFLQALSNAYWCAWNGGQTPNGCFNDPAPATSGCRPQVECVYQHLLTFINDAAVGAKAMLGGHPSHLFLGAFADVDVINTRLAAFEHYAPSVDAWGMQIYRGQNFGIGKENFIYQYSKSSIKPLIVTEYGVDAYNDPCGDANTSPCYNFAHAPPPGYGEDEETQAEWLYGLTEALTNHSSAIHKGPVAGAVIFEWMDETWRQTTGVTGCYGPIPYGQPGFDPSQCDWKAHVDCPESDLWYHSLCGYPSSSFDHYSNLAWFGLMKLYPHPGGDMDTIVPRIAFDRLKKLWIPREQSDGLLWLWLTLGTLAFAGGLAWMLYQRWKHRYEELERLGMRKELFDVDHRGVVAYDQPEALLDEDGIPVEHSDKPDGAPIVQDEHTPLISHR